MIKFGKYFLRKINKKSVKLLTVYWFKKYIDTWIFFLFVLKIDEKFNLIIIHQMSHQLFICPCIILGWL